MVVRAPFLSKMRTEPPSAAASRIADATAADLAVDQRKAYETIFDKLDKDSSGKLDAIELQQGLKSLGHPFTVEEVQVMITKADHEAEEYEHMRNSTSGFNSMSTSAYAVARDAVAAGVSTGSRLMGQVGQSDVVKEQVKKQKRAAK